MRRLFFFVNLLVIPLLSGWVVYRRLATPPADVVAVPGPFDYFKLALQWPPSICSRGDPKCPNNFTIHGLWPENFNADLKYCDNSSRYVTITGRLLQRMQSNWPDLKNHSDQTDQSFWRYQWRRHGTCSLRSFLQIQYFTLALNWRDGYDFLRHFRSHNITPGPHRYGTDLINRTVISLTSKIPDLRCKNQTLHEVRFCFDRSGVSIINCPANHCSKSCFGDIYFPQ